MFVQIMEMHTDKFEEVKAIGEEWERATEGTRTVRRRLLGRDRDNPQRLVNIVFFDSYEAAMENSNLPETERLATKLTALLGGSPSFANLDVVEDRS